MGFCSYTVILILVCHQVSFVYGGNGCLIGFLYATGTGEKKSLQQQNTVDSIFENRHAADDTSCFFTEPVAILSWILYASLVHSADKYE